LYLQGSLGSPGFTIFVIFNPIKTGGIMANYNDRGNREVYGRDYDAGRFTTRGRGRDNDREYNPRRYMKDGRYYSRGDLDIGNYGYNGDHDFQARRDNNVPSRGRVPYASDRAYQNGYYGRDWDNSDRNILSRDVDMNRRYESTDIYGYDRDNREYWNDGDSWRGWDEGMRMAGNRQSSDDDDTDDYERNELLSDRYF
jgi:hypothetical protein